MSTALAARVQVTRRIGSIAGLIVLILAAMFALGPLLWISMGEAGLIFGGRGGYSGTILGALILTVLTTLLTLLQMPEGFRRMLFGAIVLLVTAVYLRIVEDR